MASYYTAYAPVRAPRRAREGTVPSWSTSVNGAGDVSSHLHVVVSSSRDAQLRVPGTAPWNRSGAPALSQFQCRRHGCDPRTTPARDARTVVETRLLVHAVRDPFKG